MLFSESEMVPSLSPPAPPPYPLRGGEGNREDFFEGNRGAPCVSQLGMIRGKKFRVHCWVDSTALCRQTSGMGHG